MTCIIGLEHDGNVYMGADSLSSNGWGAYYSDASKIFQIGEYLVGVSGSWRLNQLLQYGFHWPDFEGKVSYEPMATIVIGVIDPLRVYLKEHGYSRISENEESTPEGRILIGFRGRVYEVQSDFSVLTYDEGFSCIGSGSLYAYGAMYAAKCDRPTNRMTKALWAAATYDPYTSNPFTFMSSDDLVREENEESEQGKEKSNEAE